MFMNMVDFQLNFIVDYVLLNSKITIIYCLTKLTEPTNLCADIISMMVC